MRRWYAYAVGGCFYPLKQHKWCILGLGFIMGRLLEIVWIFAAMELYFFFYVYKILD